MTPQRDNGIMPELLARYRDNQDAVLARVGALSEAQIAWSPNATTPSIGFHVWHLARWADYLHELIDGRGTQIWDVEGLAHRWGFGRAGLGYAETGMEMDATAARALPLPRREVLLDYARRAFEAAQRSVATITDEGFFALHPGLHGENWHDGQIGPIIITWMTHDNRHIGMIECLIGLQGESGSADA